MSSLTNKKGVYLCARKHRLAGYNIDYNDIVNYEGINLLCSCDLVDLKPYDYIIATPPCNYYSKANYRRETSVVAQQTKHLLPYCIDACLKAGKPFIIENVANESLVPFNNRCIMYSFGGHIFYSNVLMLLPYGQHLPKANKAGVCRNKRDDNYVVDLVIRIFLETLPLYYD